MAPPVIRKLKLSFIFIILSLVSGLWSLVSFAEPGKYVRVAVGTDVAALNIRVNGRYEIIDPAKKDVFLRGKGLKTAVAAFKAGIMIGGKGLDTDRVIVEAKETGEVIINGRSFRGSMELIKKNDLRFLIVNRIDLEDYIKGISVRETSHYWPVEALKAQAIAFRTFALYKMKEGEGKDYDLTSDVYSQIYGGTAAERYRINKAVDETKGMALFYADKVFPAFYHATCAGRTEDASLLWNINIAPLKGVACGFCKDSPHFKWHAVLSPKEIAEKLKAAGRGLNTIKEIKISGKDASGRIANLTIITENDATTISGKDFREAVGPNIIKSTNFSLTPVNGDIVFEGFGWGHGAGLCQWGAYFMAKQGYRYDEILKYYYPQSDVKTIGF